MNINLENKFTRTPVLITRRLEAVPTLLEAENKSECGELLGIGELAGPLDYDVNADLTVRERIIDMNIHQEEKKVQLENTWQSCCITLDKRATVFFSTLTISFMIIIFCIYQLTRGLSCEESNSYMSLLTFVVGVWVRQPEL